MLHGLEKSCHQSVLVILYLSNTVFFLIQLLCGIEILFNRYCSFVQCKNDIRLNLRKGFTLVCWVAEFCRMFPVKHP